MSLSRSAGKRSVPRISPGRWFILIAGFVLFAIVCFVLFIRSADSDYRRAEEQAIRIAKTEGGLKDIDETVRHTWDETVWIVSGKDAEGEAWTVFQRQDGIVRLKASEHLSEEQMLEKFAQSHGGEPIRVMPGWFKDGPAWEIRYWREQGEEHQSLDFYSFTDGAMLKTYVLSSS